jgi:hypothetical protein
VIVITGPGRSGTSFLASLYKELGFDPGGGWKPEENAGLEDSAFVRANERLLAALGSSAGLSRDDSPGPDRGRGHTLNRVLDWRASQSLLRSNERLATVVDGLRYRHAGLDLIDWSALDAVVAEHGTSLVQLCAGTDVVKDPRFCWTLPAWLASGAPVSTIVLAVRALDAMVDSHRRLRGTVVEPHARSWAKNNVAYGIGLTVVTAADYRVPLHTFRYPDFLADPQDLYERLPFPQLRTWEEFSAAFEKLNDSSLVHDRR